MKIVKLGQQGLKVVAVGLGCMGMSEFYGQSDDTESLKLLDEALEIGCNFWDTADMYGPFTNEELLGKALANRRHKNYSGHKVWHKTRTGWCLVWYKRLTRIR